MNKANGRFPPRYPLELMQACVLNMDMQDMGNKIIDHSGNENHGISTGNFSVSKPYGQARSFDGIDDNINVPYNTLFNNANLTVDAWIKPSVLNVYQGIVSRFGTVAADSTFMLYLSNAGKSLFYISDGVTGYNTDQAGNNTILTLETWCCLSGTFDGRYLKSYVNGLLAYTLDTGSLRSINITALPLKIGFYGTNFYTGKVNDVRIWNTARSASEIKQQFQDEAWKYGISS